MKRPQFRLWIWMVAVAVLAVVLAIVTVIRDVNQALYDFYGPGGKLERTNARAAATQQPHFDRDE